jgi:hypothetical protein
MRRNDELLMVNVKLGQFRFIHHSTLNIKHWAER